MLADGTAFRLAVALCVLGTVTNTPLAAQRGRHKAAPAAHAPLPRGPLSVQIASIVGEPAARQLHWGISVITPEGAPVYALNDDQRFIPASNQKLLTTISAFALLPPDLNLPTRVYAEGTVQSGTLTGNLVLYGGGDPSMSARALPYSDHTERTGDPLAALDVLAAQIAAAGVRTITGSVVGDDSTWTYQPLPIGWSWDDLQWEDGARVSALTVNDGVQYLNILPGAAPGDPVQFSWNPATAYYTIESSARTVGNVPGGHADVGLHRDPGSHTVRIWGTLPLNSAGAHLALAVEEPALFAAQSLRDRLLAHGVQVRGAPQARHLDYTGTLANLSPISAAPAPSGQLLASRVSPPLAQDLVVTDKVSQNLHAEMLLMDIAKQQVATGYAPLREDGIRAVKGVLSRAGVAPDDVVMRDGSGVSRQDLLTPRALTAMLRFAASQPWAQQFRSTLPVGGVDGTLSGRFVSPDMRGRVSAKTGTLSDVDSLSGYITCHSGRTVIFSVITNGHLPGNTARSAMDRVVAAIAAAN